MHLFIDAVGPTDAAPRRHHGLPRTFAISKGDTPQAEQKDPNCSISEPIISSEELVSNESGEPVAEQGDARF